MITTIISNDCMGGVICSRNHMQFKSPTVALQILPEEYTKFCCNLRHYMDCEIKEYTDVSEEHMKYLMNMYGHFPKFPLGIIDDIMVCFQHYTTFKDAKEKWNRRKARMEWEHIGYVMHMEHERYKEEVDAFLALNLPKSIAFTNGFKVGRSCRFDLPGIAGIDDFGWYQGKYTIEGEEYHEKEWLNS